MRINRLGMILFQMKDEQGDLVLVRSDGGSYDADQLDEILKDTESEWVPSTFTPCEPEGLLQLRGTFDDPQGEFTQVTILPYSTDGMVMIIEGETVVDGEPARVTMTGAMFDE